MSPAGDDNSIRTSALALLARREHTRQELLTKLAQRFSDQVKIHHQIDDLAQQGLQSDTRFVETFVRARQATGKGPARIRQELKQRGVSNYLIAAYVVDNDEQWLNTASRVYQKKFGAAPLGDVRDKAKRIRFMVSRGFPADIVFTLMEQGEGFSA